MKICFLVLLISLIFSATADDIDDVCVYTFYVKTGSVIKGGTDSKISLIIGDVEGRSVWVPDIESWGLMEPNHNYFERGNLDIFSGRGRCIDTPICRLNVTSDGSGSHHGWYCDYVEVTSTGPNIRCSQTMFRVDQWLATNISPYKLTAVLDGCNMMNQLENTGRLVVGNHGGSAAA